MLRIPLTNIDLGALCVELRPNYCSKTILVPMSCNSYSMHCKFRVLVALWGAEINEKMIAANMQLLRKMFQNALNLDLTLAHYSRGPALLESSRIVDLGALCVELRPFYCSKSILVPMSYSTIWEHSLFGPRHGQFSAL